MENDLSIAMIIREPQLEGHSLVLPKRHVKNLEDLSPEESCSLNQLVDKVRFKIDEIYNVSTVIFMNGTKQRSQEHLHYQLFPLPGDMGMRDYCAKEFNVPIYPKKTNGELKAMAEKLKSPS